MKPRPNAAVYPATTFMVITDTHFFDPSFGTSGPAWEQYMRNDRKLLAESKEATGAIVGRILESRADFVLVTGDLTKDGEAEGHRLFAAELRRLADSGIQTYVIPGNHDVNNPEAKRFTENGSENVPTVTPAQFAEIYAPYGYDKALYRDAESLSYIAEPVPGLWLLAIDSIKYDRNEKLGHSETSGSVRPETMKWIKARLADANSMGKSVIAMEHHPIMEHIYDMKGKYGEYVLDNGAELSKLLSGNDVRFIFHRSLSRPVDSQENLRRQIHRGRGNGISVTWPCEFRTVRFSGDGNTEFSSDRVAQLASYEKAGRNFDSEGYAVIAAGLKNIANDTLKKFMVPDADCARLTADIIPAMMSHYKGRCQIHRHGNPFRQGFEHPGQTRRGIYKPFIEGLWKIRPPKDVELMSDNNLTIGADGKELTD
jgi:3',5'-cyclic AMP phosphodiesterase CpdA